MDLAGHNTNRDVCVVQAPTAWPSSRTGCMRRTRVRSLGARCNHRRMPELPDVVVYIERLVAELGAATLEGVRVRSPSLLRTADPPLASAFGRRVLSFERLGKRI